MSIWSKIKDFFGTSINADEKNDPNSQKKTDVSSSNIEKLIQYTTSFINKKKLISEQIKQSKRLQKYSKNLRDISYLPIYFELEKFIINHKPPTVKQKFNKKELRKNIRKNVDIKNIDTVCSLIFLPKLEQNLQLFKLTTDNLINWVKTNLGYKRYKSIIQDSFDKNIFEETFSQDENIDLGKKTLSKKCNSERLQSAFRSLTQKLYEETTHSIGELSSSKKLQETFEFIKKTYDEDLLSTALKIIPENTLKFDDQSSSQLPSLQH